jgi:hypothetical protein
VAPLPVLTLLAALAASSSMRGAPSAEEQRLYQEGVAAFAAGDARGAERAWAAGYAVARDPAFLVRMAEAEEKAAAPAQALETYRHYLREAPDASDRAEIEQRIARLAPPPAPAPPEAAEQPGELGTGADRAEAAPPPARRAVVADVEPARPATEADSGWNAYNVTAFVAAGAAVALLGTAAFFGAQASSKESDVNRLQTFRDEATGAPAPYSSVAGQYESALADGRRDAHDARLALVASGAAAAVSIAFFVLDAHLHPAGEARVAVAPTAGAHGAALTAAWTF